MLQLLPVATAAEQASLFSTFAPETQSWVVSDLKSKLDLQKALLAHVPVVPAASVLRVSELWQQLALRLRPDLHLVSREFLLTFLLQHLSQRQEVWLRAPGAALTILEFIEQFLSVLAHPEGMSSLREWWQEDAQQERQSQQRWGQWIECAAEVWQDLRARGWVLASWLPAILLTDFPEEKIWSRQMTFALGAELKPIEAELILRLGRHHDVQVLMPVPDWREQYPRVGQAYQILASAASSSVSAHKSLAPQIEYKKFPSALAESKDAVAQVRIWLESGVAARQIAIVAADIEEYWPALSAHLAVEGVPVEKAVVAPSVTLADMQLWLARLRVRLSRVSAADLELVEFSSSRPHLSFAEFRKFFSNLYGREDLDRLPALAACYRADIDVQTLLSREEWLAWALSFYPNDAASREHLEPIYRRVLAECPPSLQLAATRWLHYFSQLAAHFEVTSYPAAADGIQVLSLRSASHLRSTHLIFLGMSEEALRKAAPGMVTLAEAMSFEARYGFQLVLPETATTEFEARWLLSPDRQVQLLCFSESDFHGKVAAPSWLWLQAAHKVGSHHHVQVPRSTRWDQMQAQDLAETARALGWPTEQATTVEKSLQQDLGLLPASHWPVEVEKKISPSALESYRKCPFIFAAERLLKLSALPELDIDVDAATRGRLLHALFAELTREPFCADRDEAELTTILEGLRASGVAELGDARIWPSLRRNFLLLAQRFLRAEAERRRRFPQTRTVGREVRVQGFWQDSEMRKSVEQPLRAEATGGVSREPVEAWIVSGVIDRVDADDSGRKVILDYKSTAGKHGNWNMWLSGNQLQLLFYALAVEAGLAEGLEGEVIGAFYYIARTLQRETGMKLSDVEPTLFGFDDRKRKRLDRDGKVKLWQDFKNYMQASLDGLQMGRFNPQPQEPSQCPECKWRNLCRAPHLNFL